MGQCERNRNLVQQREDTEYRLQGDRSRQPQSAADDGRSGPRTNGVDRMPYRERKQRIRGRAVLELYRERVVEQISPPRRFKEQPRRRWNERAVDIRPGIID